VIFVSEKEEIPALLDEIVRAGDLVMTMGAGDVWRIGEAFGRKLAEKAREPDG
jgi:UDP-N-acetylmuramate--alanine ligase